MPPKKTLYLLSILILGGCATSRVPARGDPVRVGEMQEGRTRLHELPMEQYVAGVLSKEVPADWPLDALKAQAVATRTYAVYRTLNPRDKRFDVASDTSDQVFERRDRAAQGIVRAVTETEGEVLRADGKVFETFFHSCCGGMTETADQVWPGRHADPVLNVQEDPYCAACPPSRWEHTVSREELAGLLKDQGYAVDGDWTLEVARRDPAGRVQEVLLKAAGRKPVVIAGARFRQILGYTNLKSTLFELQESDEGIVFAGRGAGHGVGLCQWGAKGMADAGKSYREILEFYYPGAELPSSSASESPAPAAQEKEILQDLQEGE